jgi:peptidoglycan/LPS O-acetylase OafA/YrhL
VLANQVGHARVFQVMTIWLPADLDLFALGMLLAVLSAWTHLRESEPAWLSKGWFPWVSWLLAVVTFWGVSHIGLPAQVIYTKTDLDIVRQVLYGVFAFFLLAPAVFGPQHRGLIRRGLQSWPMASLGVISYGLYLWHQTLIDLLVKYYPTLYGSKLFFNVGFWGMFGGIFGAAVVVAAVSYFVIEKPSLRAKRFLPWFKVSAPPPGSGPPDAGPGDGQLAVATR